MEVIIGLGELAVSNRAGDVLKTFALSSCVGLTMYSKRKRTAGMIHIVLPKPSEDLKKIPLSAYYATIGVPILINKMCHDYGCLRNELNICLFGGAESKSDKIFKIGEKNINKTIEILEYMGLNYQLVDTGGCFSRTIEMDVASGHIKLTRQRLNRFIEKANNDT